MRIIVKLWVKDRQFAKFADFEKAAFVIMARYEGRVMSIEKNEDTSDGQPDEIHVLEFPNPRAFEAYKADPDLLSMARQREDCIAKTVVSVEESDD